MRETLIFEPIRSNSEDKNKYKKVGDTLKGFETKWSKATEF